MNSNPPFLLLCRHLVCSSSSSTSSLRIVSSMHADQTAATKVEHVRQIFSDPSQLWDNRKLDKKIRKYPDFKHKTQRKALRINNRLQPPWVQARLAAVSQGQREQSFRSTSQNSGQAVRIEELWEEFFSDPSQWLDNRFKKENPIYPDFNHKNTNEALWIDSCWTPPWVKEELVAMAPCIVRPGCSVRPQYCSNTGVNRGGPGWEHIRDLSKLCQEGRIKEALQIMELMVQQRSQAPITTFSCLLQGCSRMKTLTLGKQVHILVIKFGFESNIFLGNCVLDMYAKCGSVLDARQVFEKMPERNTVSWTIIISAYVKQGQSEEALNLFQQMQIEGVEPNNFTFASILKACASLASLELGKQVHAQIIKSGLELEVFVETSLVDMYGKCGSIEDARQVFNNMHNRNVVSWNAIIMGYARQGHCEEAFRLFEHMQREGMKPDNATFVSILKACASLGALERGKQVHVQIIKSGLDLGVFVESCLVDMYGKCGCLESALEVFNKMRERDVVSWTAMMTGYAQHGRGKEAVTLFEQMRREGVKPDTVTFVAVLSACSHAGLVDEGFHLFHSMSQDHRITPTLEHYCCMVDLLGRAGRLHEAESFIYKMPVQPNAVVWTTLLGACRSHGNVELGVHAFEHVVKLEPKRAAAYVLLSNIFATAQRWDDVQKIKKEMKNAGVKKERGCSWIEVNGKVHEFSVGNRTHPRINEIQAELKRLIGVMKEEGYVPDLNLALFNMEDGHKEDALCDHSEKLAISFGLISTPPWIPIRVVKNLRVCGDCHNATKIISKIVGREIIARDASRFHHFKDGVCSCGDYW